MVEVYGMGMGMDMPGTMCRAGGMFSEGPVAAIGGLYLKSKPGAAYDATPRREAVLKKRSAGVPAVMVRRYSASHMNECDMYFQQLQLYIRSHQNYLGSIP